MKRIRVVATPDPALAPPLFGIIADSSQTDAARLHDWAPTDDGVTALFTVDGEIDGYVERLRALDAVAAAETARIDDDRFSLLVTLVPDATPLVRAVFDAVIREGLVVVKPILYRDGRVHATFVGESDALQTALSAIPPLVDLAVTEVGSYRGGPTTAPAAALSDRQREALRTAVDLGYYDPEGGVTHADVADALGCAPSTASEHLQKAETTLVHEVLGDPDD